jgi:hypothetical protein
VLHSKCWIVATSSAYKLQLAKLLIHDDWGRINDLFNWGLVNLWIKSVFSYKMVIENTIKAINLIN